jgi:tetratricopeptide (TPR) repeat protein
VDPVTGEARFPGRTRVRNEEDLVGAVRSLASGVLGYLQLQVLQLANDNDLRPWISLRQHNIQAVNAFIQASQHIFRFERVAAERDLERAIELDPAFIEPRVWIIPGLITQNKVAEAQRHYDALVELESGASPFEQAMIGYVGARLRADIPAQARQLEVALDYLPGNNVLLVNLAGARERLGDCPGALDALRPVVDMRWQFPAMYELWGTCSIQAGRIDEGKRVLIDVTSRPPVHPNVYALLEALAIVDGDAAGAARYATAFETRTRELDRPASVEPLAKPYGKLASDCLSRGQYECAAKLFAKALAAHPAAEYFDGLGRTFEKMGDRALAEVQYRKALANDPTWSHASERLRELTSERR